MFAILKYFTGPALGWLAVIMAVGVFYGGYSVRDYTCNAAQEKTLRLVAEAEVAKLNVELKGYKDGAAAAALATEELTKLKETHDAQLKALKVELAKNKNAVCRPTADSVRRLLNIR
jgi:hypothetical protein